MAGFQTASVGNITVQRGRPATPMVDICLVRPIVIPAPKPAGAVQRSKDIRPYTVVTTSMRKEMRARRAAGESKMVIAKALGVTPPTVLRHTRDIQPPEGGWQTGGHRSKVPIEGIHRMRRAGFTWAEIGENFGITASAAWRRVHEPVRTRQTGNSRKPINRVLQRLAYVTGFHQSEIRRERCDDPRRSTADLARARHILFWMLVRHFKMSTPVAAKSTGGFDHTSVIFGVRRVDRVLDHHGICRDQYPVNLIRALWAADWARTAR